MNELQPYYTVKEIANKLNIKPSLLYSFIRNGKLSCVKAGNKYLIELEAVRACFNALKRK